MILGAFSHRNVRQSANIREGFAEIKIVNRLGVGVKNVTDLAAVFRM